MIIAFRTEWLKFRRARTPWAIAVIVVIAVPAMTVAMLLAARGQAGGVMAGKVENLMADASVAGQLGLAAQMLSVFALLGGGFLTAWVCGREFSDGTIGGMFALPISRGRIVLAKLAIAWAWTSIFALIAALTTMFAIVALNGWDIGALSFRKSSVLLGSAILTAMLSTPFGFIASIARGYLVPLAVLIGTVAVTQLMAAFGVDAWFPFAVPALWAGAGGSAAAASVSVAHIASVPILALIAAALTVRYWDRLRLA